MPTDRLLVTLLRSLQTHSDQQDTPQLLATGAALLSTLANPLNLTIVTAQLLCSPAIWTQPDGLRSCLRFLGVFQSAAFAIVQYEERCAEDRLHNRPTRLGQTVVGGNIPRDEWIKAVIKGADDRSPRWRHVMVIASLLIGFEDQDRQALTKSLRMMVEQALVKAINLALDEVGVSDELGAHSIALALNYSFELLSEYSRSQLNYDRLLPVLIGTAFFSNEGYKSAYYLAPVDVDVFTTNDGQLTWSDRSVSFSQLTEMSSNPLVAGMGPLSKLIAYTVENVSSPWLIQTMMDDLTGYSKTLEAQWRRTKLSQVDASEEQKKFDEATLSRTLPLLWRLLRTNLFAISIVLQAVMGRILNDSGLADDTVAPGLACQTLSTLRNFYFISSRLGSNAFTQHTFVYLAAIDILASYPMQSEDFLRQIRPTNLGTIPDHPLDRTHDLFFLNTAEHFTLILSPSTNEHLLIASTLPYLSAAGNPHLLPIFESAHSVILSVLSSPQSAHTADLHLPFYVSTLLSVFPTNLSTRQFRLAFKTLLRIVSPPAPLSHTRPDLPETLLELLHHRACATSTRPAPYAATSSTPQPPPAPALAPENSAAQPGDASAVATDNDADERTALTLTLLDSLVVISAPLLHEWLPRAAALVMALEGAGREKCRARLYEVLMGGEMDMERSLVGVKWWGNGGREILEEEPMMSGALVRKVESRL